MFISTSTQGEFSKQGEEAKERAGNSGLPHPARRETQVWFKGLLDRGGFIPCWLQHPRVLLRGGAVPSSDRGAASPPTQKTPQGCSAHCVPAPAVGGGCRPPSRHDPGLCSHHPAVCSTLFGGRARESIASELERSERRGEKADLR